MSRIFWDTNLFVYLVEQKGPLSRRVEAVRRRMIVRGDDLFTSALTLGELLVKPVTGGNRDLTRRYEQLVLSGATVLPFDLRAAPHFAEICQDRSIRAPDAIQLACAAAAGTDLFITNDRRLRRKQVRGIEFIQSLDEAAI